ncbi:MBL fold metallo-hydrolase [Variovorax sp. J22R133]|uniref:MBL fold metallo-hydrolase n=1 Tax=Variovorax brevis TaxID=3053503 RepID=UPI002574A61E|nr:MBL fold metallo-hydrolase [Variovorax sp. J22R133]MDM0117034.1 MBL fold metallo-hydrolase [Variovorax sp. J22R133]
MKTRFFATLAAVAGLCAGCSTPDVPRDLKVLHATSSASLTVRYFGVSSMYITDGKSSILVDGFFSRPSLARLIFGPVVPDEGRITSALHDGQVTSANLILVAHSHHDHAMDTGAVAKRIGGRIIGSESTKVLVQQQCPQCTVQAPPPMQGEVKEGAFTVRFLQLAHTRTPIVVRFPGEITEPLGDRPNVASYRMGANFAFLIGNEGRRLLIVPGADHESLLPAGFEADVVFLGIANLGKRTDKQIADYWHNIIGASKPRRVILIHWDDFTLPLSEGLKALPPIADDMPKTVRVMQALALHEKRELAILPLFEPVAILPEE